jgi:hypothetical protein
MPKNTWYKIAKDVDNKKVETKQKKDEKKCFSWEV